MIESLTFNGSNYLISLLYIELNIICLIPNTINRISLPMQFLICFPHVLMCIYTQLLYRINLLTLTIQLSKAICQLKSIGSQSIIFIIFSRHTLFNTEKCFTHLIISLPILIQQFLVIWLLVLLQQIPLNFHFF